MDRIQLREIHITNFRNLANATLLPHDRFNIISGNNGMGKTNFIESVYMLGALRSFRTSARTDLISHGNVSRVARVLGIFSGLAGGLRCEISLEETRRSVRVDGKAMTSANEHFHKLPMVLFHPATMSLVQGGKEIRRRFMDRALFQAERSYPAVSRDYARALSSRNKLLKNKPVDKRAVVAFDGQLVKLGKKIIGFRRSLIDGLEPFFLQAVAKISSGLDGKIAYQPKVDGGEEELLLALREKYSMDVARGYTSVGPHGDDLSIEIDGRPAKKFASQGQQRILALALKIAETNILSQRTGSIPLLLLDDVSSELDRERNKHLFRFLSEVGGQVFITTTHLSHIPLGEKRRDFEVEEGIIRELD